jgi:hypothetical protein
MRGFLLFAMALLGLWCCEEHVSSDPPPRAAESVSSSPDMIDKLLGSGTADAGPVAMDSSHALTVTSCSASPQQCPASEADASAEASYRVVFGSGRGAIRGRGQAMADLYRELRDRTALGEKLGAQPRAPEASDASTVFKGRAPKQASTENSDPIAHCAFQLLDLVDSVGEVTLDVVHGAGSSGCMVSLGKSPGDGGAVQCLVKEPERPRRPGKGGLQF